MRTTTLWSALSKCQHQIAEVLPVHGGRFDARLRQEAKFADSLQKRMDERDLWRVPAQNWLKLVEIGEQLTAWNNLKMKQENAAALSQKRLSQISRQWHEMTDIARGRTPAKQDGHVVSTITVPFNSETRTSA